MGPKYASAGALWKRSDLKNLKKYLQKNISSIFF